MSGTALKRVLSRAQMRLADRSDACEGPGWARTEHMQQESGYVGGVPKMAAGAEAFLEDAGCWQASLQNARELLEAAGARERARVGGSGRRVDCPRAWLAPGSPEEGTTPRPAKDGAGWLGFFQNYNPEGTRRSAGHLASPRAYNIRIVECECRRIEITAPSSYRE